LGEPFHVAALLQRKLLGLPALVLGAAAGTTTAAEGPGLVARGVVGGRRSAHRTGLADRPGTDRGRAAVRTAVEADTNRLAQGPWAVLGDVGCDRLAELLTPVRRAVIAAGDWPPHNPIGVPDPD
jgi:hypothetical protein